MLNCKVGGVEVPASLQLEVDKSERNTSKLPEKKKTSGKAIS